MYVAFWDEHAAILNALNDTSFFDKTMPEMKEEWGMVGYSDFDYAFAHPFPTGGSNPGAYYEFGKNYELPPEFYTVTSPGAEPVLDIYEHDFFMIFINEDNTYYAYTDPIHASWNWVAGNLVFDKSGVNGFQLSFTPSNIGIPITVPEPSTALLLVAGGVVLGLRRRRKTGGVK